MNKMIFMWRLFVFTLLFINTQSGVRSQKAMKMSELTPFERYIIEDKGTERPFSGIYWNVFDDGSYHCKRCGALLYHSADKFESQCGWPSFDDAVEGAVKHLPDADGSRTEILCANCDAHLGHVFTGEGLTSKNVRHCVNSASLQFIAQEPVWDTAIFASGCFWGTEYHFSLEKGVIRTTVGYTGGTVKNPDYRRVCSGKTGHVEAVKVVFNPQEVTYRDLLQVFFETHDFTQKNGQGPDIGSQYLSRIFYSSEEQKQQATKTIQYLSERKGYKVATLVLPAGDFYPAEDYHQEYYQKNGGTPYCHIRRSVF